MSPLTVLARSSTWSAPSCGLAGALEVGVDGAGDGGDVGPDGGAGRDADLDVARGALDGDLAAARARRRSGRRCRWPARRRCRASPTRRSPEPVLTAAGPLLVPISTSPDPVETATASSACRTVTSPEPLLIRSAPPRGLDEHVARAGLDHGRAGRRGRASTSPEPVLTWQLPTVPSTVTSALPVLAGEVAPGRDGHDDVAGSESPSKKPARWRGRDDADLRPDCSTWTSSASRPVISTSVSVVSVAVTWTRALADLDVQGDRLVGLEVVLGHDCLQGVLVHGTGLVAGPRCVGGGGWCGAGVRPSRSCACCRVPSRRTGRSRRRRGCSRGRCRR